MAAVLSILLLALTLIAFYLQQRWLGKTSYVTVTGKGDAGVPAALPRGVRWICLMAVIPWMVMTFLLYGLIAVAGFVKNWGNDYTWTLEHFKAAFDVEYSPEFGMQWMGSAWNSFWTTLGVASLAAPITALFGLLTAYLLVRQQFRGKPFFEFATLLSFAVPGTVVGIGYILAFNGPPIELTGTAIILVLCFVFRNMPTGVRAGIAAMSQLDKSLDEASITLGASSWTTFRKVLIPLLRPALTASLIFGFARAMTAVSAVIFLVSADYDLATSYILGRVEATDYGIATVYSFMLIVVILLVVGLIHWIVGKRQLGRRMPVIVP